MSQGQLEVTHTDSSFAPDIAVNVINSSLNIDILYKEAYDYLRSQEIAFYHQFFPDVNDIETFIARIRALLAKSQADLNCLKSFSNAELSNYLPDKQLPYFQQGHKIILKGAAARIDCNYTGNNITMSGVIAIDIIPQNVQRIKHLLNVGLNRSKATSFDETSNKITDNLVSMLRDQNFGDLFIIQEGNKQKSASNDFLQEFDIRTVSKREYNKKNIDKILKDPNRKDEASKLRMEARKSLYKMQNFIYNKMSGTSPEFQQAVKETWKEIFPSMGDDVLTRRFFFEGENYMKALLGQGGEFFNDVMLRYLDKVTENTNPLLAKIIGSELKGGQQPHSDLQIMLACGAKIGFQTKNITGEREIDVKTNGSLILENFGAEVVSPLVNYFANTDYAAEHANLIEQIEQILSERFFQAMNLNVSSGLNDTLHDLQVNTFYFVGGSHIIPGSSIIEDIMYKKEVRPSYTITGGRVASASNDEYRTNFEKYFYWKYLKGSHNVQPSDMVSTPKNSAAFNKAAASISISTSFSVSALLDSGTFRIFT